MAIIERADKGLAFMLQYENVAWYDSGEVRILDRRVYPRKIEFVGEGKRWFDLVRYAERKSATDDSKDGMTSMFEKYMTGIEGYKTIMSRCDNLWGLYCPIYYMECKAYRANGSTLTQNPVWNKSKYDR